MDKSIINSRFVKSANYLINNRISRDKAKITEGLGIGAIRPPEILNNRTKAGTDLIACLRFKYDVSSDWILMGEGPMFRDNKISGGSKQVHTSDTIPILSNENFTSIPLAEISVAASCSGYDNPSCLDIIDVIGIPPTMLKDNGQYFCIRMKGESMTPTTLDGSYIITRTPNRSEWGHVPDRHVYIISDRNGRAYLERVKNRLSSNGFIICMFDNADKLNCPSFDLEEQRVNCAPHAEWALSAKMPNLNGTYYDKVNQLEDKYDILESQMRRILQVIKDKQSRYQIP